MMKKAMKRCVITVGKPDAHKEIHFGHLSGGLVCADIYARFLRRELGNENVLFLSGTECYGSAVETAFSAQSSNRDSILDFVKTMHSKQANVLKMFQIEFNGFFCDATDEKLHAIHTDICQKMVEYLSRDSLLFKKRERILTDENGRFLNYREICPKTPLNEKQITNEIYYTEPTENLVIKRTGEAPKEFFEENYFIDFSKREATLREQLSAAAGEYIKYLDRALSPKTDGSQIGFRVSSSANWGIDVAIEGARHKLWVWLDSILAPLSFTAASCKSLESAYRWWGGEDSKVVHYIAEDNLKFYSVLESFLISVWNEFSDKKIKFPELKLTPMRRVKSEYGLPTGEALLTYYTPEQIRYCIAAMGEKSAIFHPLRYNKREMLEDNVSGRCDSLMKKIDSLVRKAESIQQKSPTVKPDSQAIALGEQIYSKYYKAMSEKKTHRAVDIIEENLKYTVNCKDNAVYYAELFLYMLYPILPNYSAEKYSLLFEGEHLASALHTTK